MENGYDLTIYSSGCETLINRPSEDVAANERILKLDKAMRCNVDVMEWNFVFCIYSAYAEDKRQNSNQIICVIIV